MCRLVVGIVLTPGLTADAGTKYVSPTGAGAKTGADWANAYDSIQTAINSSAASGDIVYLKYGTYSLTSQLAISNRPGLTIKGGYQGIIGTPGVLTNLPSLVKRDAAITYMRIGHIYHSTATVERVTAANGQFNVTGLYGAGFLVESSSALTMRDCVVSNNNLIQGDSQYGAAIYMNGGRLNISGSRFVNNRISGGWWWEQGYGGAIACINVDVAVSNAQFIGNYVSTRAGYQRGGTMYLSGGPALLVDNVWSNSTAASQYVHDYPSCYSWGGAIYAINSVPLVITSNTFTRCSAGLTDGSAVEFGDVLYLDGATQARITGCRMTGNGRTSASRTVYIKTGDTWLDRVTIGENNGTAIYMAAGTLSATNLLVYGQSGHGLWAAGGTARLLHSTIVRNTGMGVTNNGGTVSLTNSIVYWHPSTTYIREQQTNIAGAGVTLAYSCAYPEPPGAGNTDADPEFESIPLNNYRLHMGSPCVDAGLASGIAMDLDNRVRPQDGNGSGGSQYDMGAYELTNAAAGTLRCDFTASTNHGWNSLSAIFTANVAGSSTSITWYGWDFNNDGSFDRSGPGYRIVTNTYSSYGWYDVTLRVTNTLNQSASTTRWDYIRVLGAPFHVAATGSNMSPFDTWAKAATSIQTALDTAYPGGTVLVTNGTYAITTPIRISTAVRLLSLSGSALTVLDANASSGSRRRILEISGAGAEVDGFTFKRGYSATSGTDANGGAIYMTASSLVRNCTFTNNIAVFGAAVHMNSGMISNCLFRNNSPTDLGGGGGSGCGTVYMTGGTVENCTISSNNATRAGAGICMTGGTVRRSTISHNTAGHGGGGIAIDGLGLIENCLLFKNSSGSWGGGGGGIRMNVAGSRILNCTVADNRTLGTGGGIYHSAGSISNCIIYYNTLTETGADDDLASTNNVRYSCSPVLASGAGNLTAVPNFVDRALRNYRPASGSPCRDSGATLPAITLDREGNSRPADGDGDTTPEHDMGAYEAAATDGGPLRCGFSTLGTEALGSLAAVFTATVEGANTNPVTYRWDFTNDGSFERTGTMFRKVTNIYSPGRYTVRLVVSNGVGEVTNYTRLDYLRVSPTNLYVSQTGSNTAPYDTWAKAANTIADAIDLAYAGSTIRVTNGTYGVSAQLNLAKGVTLRSMNGKLVTFLQRSSGTIRVIGVSHPQAILDGFTIRNASATSMNGGGANLAAGLIRNCTFTNNSAAYGGGLYASGGTISNCTFVKNTVTGGGGDGQGGGLYLNGTPLVTHCVVRNNTSARAGAGINLQAGTVRNTVVTYNTDGWGGSVVVAGGQLINCLVYGNKATSATPGGGGVLINGASARVLNCTIVGNEAFGASGGGIYFGAAGTVTNSIIWYNYATGVRKDLSTNTGLSHCCSPDLVHGLFSNITNAPGFLALGSGYGAGHVPGDYHPDKALPSPCIDRGVNQGWMTTIPDLDGSRRLRMNRVDMGCYEYNPPPGTLMVVR